MNLIGKKQMIQPPQWMRAFYGDAFWTTQRAIIVSLYLFCAGLGQAAAVDQGQDWRRFWKRWAQVAACALLVSLGSALVFPGSWIAFGVLHAMALMLILARLLSGVAASSASELQRRAARSGRSRHPH